MMGREMVWSNVAQLLHAFLRVLPAGSWRRGRENPRHRDARPEAQGTAEDQAEPSFANDRFDRRLPTRYFQRSKFFEVLIAPTTTLVPLFLAVLLGELGEDPEYVRALASTSAAFLHHSFDLKTKRFHNHLSFDRQWLDDRGSEDCQGRALWALGVAVGRSPFESFQMMGRTALRAGVGPR